ncbi:uncharacterized protein J3R85_016906 [Psidium guajava]|nr:uncharacterized protein J3R85_016906 [Psidium guajava]
MSPQMQTELDAKGSGDESSERKENVGEDGARVGREEAICDGLSVDLVKVFDAAAFLEDDEKRRRTGNQHQDPSFGIKKGDFPACLKRRPSVRARF